jgi:hypothetical protein
MIIWRLALPVACVVLWAPSVSAQDLSRYREFQFGMSLAAVAQQAGVSLAAARVVHERPARIEELDWRPAPVFAAQPGQGEPVRIARFLFYEGRLFRIAVSYDRDRTEGLTTEDIVEALSASYGPPVLPATRIPAATALAHEDSGFGYDMTLAAHWQDSQYSINLVRSSHGFGFGLVLFSKRDDAAARLATTEAIRLDVQQAPQREVDRLKEQADVDRARHEKARLVNRLAFRF